MVARRGHRAASRLVGIVRAKRSAPVTYLVAGTLAVLAIVLTRVTGDLRHQVPYTLSFGAVMVASWYGGLGAGLFAVAISVLGVDFVVRDIPHSITFRQSSTALSALVFVAIALMISALNDARRRAETRSSLALAEEHIARLEADEGRDRMSLLAQASLALASSFEFEITLRQVAKLVTPRFADWCAMYVAGDDDRIERLTTVGVAEGASSWVADLRPWYALSEPIGLSKLIATATPQLVPHAPGKLLEGGGGDESGSSAMVLPMVSRNHVLGALLLVANTNARQTYDADDLAFGEVLARRCAQAVDNARLYRDAQTAEARYRSLFEGTAEAIIVADTTGRCLDANQAATELLGYSREEIRQLDIGDISRASWDASAPAQPAVRLHETWSGDVVLRRKDGTLVPAEGRGRDVTLPMGTVFVSAWRDVSERKEMEQLQQEFIASVSHDLKNPLSAASALTQLTQRRLSRDPNPPSGEIAATLVKIHDALSRTTALLDELSDAARARLGQPLELVGSRVDLVELARESVQKHQRTTDRHEIVLVTDLDEVIGEWDRNRLLRVFDNLVSNAVKYSPEGGRIEVRVSLDQQDATPVAVVAVSDSGVGIPAADLPNLFRPYFRATNVLGRFGGTGVGLSGVRQIVDQHGGTIAVESEPGRGSTFTVRLPLTAVPVLGVT